MISTAVFTYELRQLYFKASLEVCDLIETHYFKRDEPDVRNFLADCRHEAGNQKFVFSKSANIKRLNARLSKVRISHLSLYEPAENLMMWENQGLDTGIRSRIVENALLISRVVPKSPAALAGLEPGDELLSLNGEMIATPWQAQSGAGWYEVEKSRSQGRRNIFLKPEVVSDVQFPSVREVAPGVGLLKIPSFLAWYFENPQWLEVVRGLSRWKALIIDVRENPGGSYPAMLRALSPFRCGNTFVGELFRSTRSGGAATQLQDDLDSESQLRQLESVDRVRLNTFANYGCFQGPVVVLTDSGTSSVSEIFAASFFERARSNVLGESTAGQVVLARWIPVRSFGSDDYQLSIPIAGYRAADGRILEDAGVKPMRYLSYELNKERLGRDSWLEVALKLLPH